MLNWAIGVGVALLMVPAAAAATSPSAAQQSAPLRTVRVLATGGTIAGVGQANSSSYRPGVVPIDDILRTVPGLTDLANVTAEQVTNVASSEMDEALWLRLLGRVQAAVADPTVSGVVITHGTDTLEETAFFLSLVLSSTKPVVIVGSMRPGTAASADGPQNLLDAIRVAISDQARDRGVLVVMNDTIFDPASVAKDDVRRVNAFAARSRGPIGDVLTEAPRFFANAAPHGAGFAIVTQDLPRVAVVYGYAGLRAEDIRSAARGVRGLIYAGAGPGASSASTKRVLTELTSRGVVVVRTARQGHGDVWPSGSDRTMGTIAGRELTPAKARILLMLALQEPRTAAQLQALFDRYGTGQP